MDERPKQGELPWATLREVDGFLVIELPDGVKLTGDPVAEAREERDREILGDGNVQVDTTAQDAL